MAASPSRVRPQGRYSRQRDEQGKDPKGGEGEAGLAPKEEYRWRRGRCAASRGGRSQSGNTGAQHGLYQKGKRTSTKSWNRYCTCILIRNTSTKIKIILWTLESRILSLPISHQSFYVYFFLTHITPFSKSIPSIDWTWYKSRIVSALLPASLHSRNWFLRVEIPFLQSRG